VRFCPLPAAAHAFMRTVHTHALPYKGQQGSPTGVLLWLCRTHVRLWRFRTLLLVCSPHALFAPMYMSSLVPGPPDI
jgi:hypothetical protein